MIFIVIPLLIAIGLSVTILTLSGVIGTDRPAPNKQPTHTYTPNPNIK